MIGLVVVGDSVENLDSVKRPKLWVNQERN